jgi:archaellum component FlaC
MGLDEVTINEKSMEVLITKLIPTSQYFERSFEFLQHQIEELKVSQKNMQDGIDKRFEDMQCSIDKRFEQVDKRFEQVDKKFEQVNDSINNLAFKIENLAKSQETTIRDYIIERDRHYDSKFNSLRLFNLATISIVAGIILKMMGVITI